jgi:hypothetical protein
MEPTEPGSTRQDEQQPANCNVSMRFNFAVGAVALILAALIGLYVWR